MNWLSQWYVALIWVKTAWEGNEVISFAGQVLARMGSD